MFSRFLKALDQFGSYIRLNYKKESKVKTHFGGVLTILAAIATLVMSYVFGSEIIFREKPSISFSKVRRNLSEVYMKDFPFMIYLTNNVGEKLQNVDSLLTIYGQQYILDDNGNSGHNITVLKNVTVSDCKPDKHYGQFKEIIMNTTSNQMLCVNTGEHTRFYNDYGAIGSAFINIKLSVCDNSTRAEGNKCAPQEVIDKQLNEFYVMMFFIDYYVDPLKFQNPETTYLNQVSMRGSNHLYRRSYFRIISTDIQTDVGLIQNETSTKRINQLDSIKTDIDMGATDPFLKFHITLESPVLGDIYSRTYTRLIFVIANIGGILNLILVCGKILSSKISEYSFFFQEAKDMINFQGTPAKLDEENESFNENSQIRILTFQDKNRKATDFNQASLGFPMEDKPKEEAKSNEIIVVNSRLHLSENKQIKQEASPKSSSNVLFDFSRKKRNLPSDQSDKDNNKNLAPLEKSKIGFIDYLKVLCWKKGKEKKYLESFYEAVKHYFKKQLDVISLIKNNHKLETIKFMLFSHANGYDSLFSLKLLPIDLIENFERDRIVGKTETELSDVETKIKDSLALNEENEEKRAQNRVLENILRIKGSIERANIFN